MRTKNNFIFTVFSLVMLVGLLQLNWFFKDYFGEGREYKAQVLTLNHELERQKLKVTLVQNQFVDFQQDLAAVLPNTTAVGANNHRLKEWSQVLRAPASEKAVDTSAILMGRGRQEFKDKRYDRAAVIFKEVIEKFPVSSQLIDAYFLLGESLFQNEQYDECLNIAYDMITHFPQNQMTGYLMLRNGQILSMRKRTLEANEVFQIVSENFSGNKELSEQARRLALGK